MHLLFSKALSPGSEGRASVRADAVYPDTRGGGVGNREDNLGARFGLIRNHQLAMPGLFNVMK